MGHGWRGGEAMGKTLMSYGAPCTSFTPPTSLTPHTCWPKSCRGGEQCAAASWVLGVMLTDGEGVVPAARDVKDALAIDSRHDLTEWGIRIKFEFKQ